MDGFEMIRYEDSWKEKWDEFVEHSKNGTFLLKRDYMDYHSDRFEDFSLIIKSKGKIYALLPACKSENTLSSHAGLTYGGLIMNERCCAQEILDLMETLRTHFRKEGFREWIYKPVPHIYHKMPAEEDLYALFRINATLKVRNISATLLLSRKPELRKLRKRKISQAEKSGITTGQDEDFPTFWNILEKNLHERYATRPVHTLKEMESLVSSFPQNIKLYTSKMGKEVLAGIVCYICDDTVHCQYIASSPLGKESGALDLLFDRLIDEEFRNKKYFDFGTSNEDNGRYLNDKLIFYKEGFGARAICYDTYRISF